jgi:hypothetical protein
MEDLVGFVRLEVKADKIKRARNNPYEVGEMLQLGLQCLFSLDIRHGQSQLARGFHHSI